MTIDFASAHPSPRLRAPLDPAPAESIASLADDLERFNAQREALRRYCFAILRNEADAEDAVQVTLERALRYQSAQLDNGRWLTAIARNVCRDLLSATHGVQHVPLEEAAQHDESRAPLDVEQDVARRSALECALGSLTPTERRAVSASWIFDQTSYDAARTMGLAHQTLRVHLARARKKLALYLDELERASAAFVPWLLNVPHRASRRVTAALSRDAALSDRLLLMTAPPLALAVTIASVAVLATHTARDGRTSDAASAPAMTLSLPRPAAAASHGSLALSGSTTGVSTDMVRTLLPAISPGRQQDAYVSDVEPSPDYAQDRTLFASATDSACGARAACGELYMSADAGRTWTNLRPVGLQPFAQLLLPAGTYASGTFYAFGSAGLQMTTDRGRTFTTLVSDLPGYAGLMPPGSATFVSVANVDLWNFAGAATPGLVGAYPPGTLAAGSALAVPAAAGWTFLQPVQVPGQAERLLECGSTPACSLGAALPWSDQTTKLVASPDGQVIAALNAAGLAISRDGGATFNRIPQPFAVGSADVGITLGPDGGVRLLLLPGFGRPAEAPVVYSDDLGGTWLGAAGLGLPGSIPRLIRQVDGSRLILELGSAAHPTALDAYRCSADGGAFWTSC